VIPGSDSIYESSQHSGTHIVRRSWLWAVVITISYWLKLIQRHQDCRVWALECSRKPPSLSLEKAHII